MNMKQRLGLLYLELPHGSRRSGAINRIGQAAWGHYWWIGALNYWVW